MIQAQKNKSVQCAGLCCTTLDHVTVTMGKHNILKDVNLHIHCGELTAIIGPNGAGKSTLLKAILGEIRHSGEVRFLGENEDEARTPRMGYVPQHLNFDTGTPTSVLDLWAVCRSRFPAWIKVPGWVRKTALECLSRVEADQLIDQRLGELSGGELQRVLLALAMDPMPDLLLLDEPVSGMDPNGLELFYKTVSELRKRYDLSILLVSHDFEMVERYADRVILLDGHVVCSGTPREVLDDPRTHAVFGLRNRGLGETKD